MQRCRQGCCPEGGLGRGHKVLWRKPTRPDWLDQQTYDRLPAELVFREVCVNTDIPGFRSRSLVIATSLCDAIEFPQADLAALYRRRWDAELRLREIKSLMELDVLRCKTPDMVHQELWAGFLAYNLIRQSMLQSAQANAARPEHLSFTAPCSSWPSTGCPPWSRHCRPPTRPMR